MSRTRITTQITVLCDVRCGQPLIPQITHSAPVTCLYMEQENRIILLLLKPEAGREVLARFLMLQLLQLE